MKEICDNIRNFSILAAVFAAQIFLFLHAKNILTKIDIYNINLLMLALAMWGFSVFLIISFGIFLTSGLIFVNFIHMYKIGEKIISVFMKNFNEFESGKENITAAVTGYFFGIVASIVFIFVELAEKLL